MLMSIRSKSGLKSNRNDCPFFNQENSQHMENFPSGNQSDVES